MQKNLAIVSSGFLFSALQNNSAGSKITTIPAAFAALQMISSHENEIKTGLHQQ